MIVTFRKTTVYHQALKDSTILASCLVFASNHCCRPADTARSETPRCFLLPGSVSFKGHQLSLLNWDDKELSFFLFSLICFFRSPNPPTELVVNGVRGVMSSVWFDSVGQLHAASVCVCFQITNIMGRAPTAP